MDQFPTINDTNAFLRNALTEHVGEGKTYKNIKIFEDIVLDVCQRLGHDATVIRDYIQQLKANETPPLLTMDDAIIIATCIDPHMEMLPLRQQLRKERKEAQLPESLGFIDLVALDDALILAGHDAGITFENLPDAQTIRAHMNDSAPVPVHPVANIIEDDDDELEALPATVGASKKFNEELNKLVKAAVGEGKTYPDEKTFWQVISQVSERLGITGMDSELILAKGCIPSQALVLGAAFKLEGEALGDFTDLAEEDFDTKNPNTDWSKIKDVDFTAGQIRDQLEGARVSAGLPADIEGSTRFKQQQTPVQPRPVNHRPTQIVPPAPKPRPVAVALRTPPVPRALPITPKPVITSRPAPVFHPAAGTLREEDNGPTATWPYEHQVPLWLALSQLEDAKEKFIEEGGVGPRTDLTIRQIQMNCPSVRPIMEGMKLLRDGDIKAFDTLVAELKGKKAEAPPSAPISSRW